VNQSTLVYLKLGIIGLYELGVFTLAAIGKISPDAALSAATAGVGTLVVALGISSAASALASAKKPG
jgi:hypothetical protein